MKRKRIKSHKNKGISPLIATVLIIGFTIVIGSMVMIWGGEIFNKYQTQTETESLSKLTCATKVNLNIMEACDLGSSIRIKIENAADQEVQSFIYRVISPSGALIKTKEQKLSPFGVGSFITDPYTGILYIKPTTLEVFPKILIDGKESTCPSTSKEIRPCYLLPMLNKLDDWDITGATSTTLIAENKEAQDLLKSLTITEHTGFYVVGSGIKITSKNTFLIPTEAKYFFIRVIGAGAGEINYKLIIGDDSTTYSGSITVAADTITDVAVKEFELGPSDYGKNAKIEVSGTGDGAIAIVNFGYL